MLRARLKELFVLKSNIVHTYNLCVIITAQVLIDFNQFYEHSYVNVINTEQISNLKCIYKLTFFITL